MTNLTQWVGGALNSSTLTPQTAFGGSDINVTGGLANGLSVLSGLTFDNTSPGDQFMDIFFSGALASAQTLTAGACISLWLAINDSGSTFGDGRLTSSTPLAYTPILNPLGAIPFQVGGPLTNLVGCLTGLVIPPRLFGIIMQNNTGFTLAATGNVVAFNTYRLNTND